MDGFDGGSTPERFRLPRVGDEKVRRGLAAQSRVQRGQVSRARHELTGTPLAPKTEATLQVKQAPTGKGQDDPSRSVKFRPRVPSPVRRQIVREVFADCAVRQCPRSGGLHE